jgi:hypothetical protein
MLSGSRNESFDAGRKQYVDLIEAGIIDPTKLVRIGLENAVSIASVLLLTKATMTEIPEQKRDRASEPEMALYQVCTAATRRWERTMELRRSFAGIVLILFMVAGAESANLKRTDLEGDAEDVSWPFRSVAAVMRSRKINRLH